MGNAREIADLYASRAARFSEALARGMRRALVAVDIEHSKRLAGSADAAPGAYPVPIRTGHLQRSRGTRLLSDSSGLVFNRARYANAVHTGFRPYGNPKARPIGPRPFLADAVEEADPTQYVFAALRQAVHG